MSEDVRCPRCASFVGPCRRVSCALCDGDGTVPAEDAAVYTLLGCSPADQRHTGPRPTWLRARRVQLGWLPLEGYDLEPG